MFKKLWMLACFVLAMTFMHAAPAMAGVIGDTALCTVWVREHAVLNGRVGITEAEAMRLPLGFRYQRPDGTWHKLEPAGAHFWGDCRSFVSAGGRISAAATTAAQPPKAADAPSAADAAAEAARIAAEAARVAAEAEVNAQAAKRLAAWFAEQGDAAATWARNAVLTPTGDWLSAIPAVAKTIFAASVTLVLALLAYFAYAINRARTENPEPIERPELPLVHQMPFQSPPPVEYAEKPEPTSLMDAFAHPDQPPEPELSLEEEVGGDILPDAANQDTPVDPPRFDESATLDPEPARDIAGLLQLLHGPEHADPKPPAPVRDVDIMGAIEALHGPRRLEPEPPPIPVGDVAPSLEFQRMLEETRRRIAGGDR